jgi:hypothetical protein
MYNLRLVDFFKCLWELELGFLSSFLFTKIFKPGPHNLQSYKFKNFQKENDSDDIQW